MHAMDERQHQDPQQRMTDDEAEAVIERFREEEEAMSREMEARASMPTVKDLAEGLNVAPERIQLMLVKIRKERAPAQQQDQGMEQVRSKNRNVYAIAIAAFVPLMVLGVFAALLFSSATPPSQAPQPVESTGTIPAETADPIGETLEPAIG